MSIFTGCHFVAAWLSSNAFSTCGEDDMTHVELENRIRHRAHQIWLDAGCPEGQAEHHWELARLAVADEDGRASGWNQPVVTPLAEPVAAMANHREVPTMADQGEVQFPGREPAERAAPAPAARKARSSRTTRKN
jgi:hypothetical protein